jgi:hypothetical protein
MINKIIKKSKISILFEREHKAIKNLISKKTYHKYRKIYSFYSLIWIKMMNNMINK